MKLHKYLQSIEKDGIQAILEALPKILKNYNNTEHTTTKTAPNDVNNNNEEQVLNNIIARSNHQIRKDVNIGDSVRLRHKHKSFVKGHEPAWTKGVFQVVDRESVYYVIDGENKYNEPVRKDRMYLRSAIQKVDGDVETNPNLKQI